MQAEGQRPTPVTFNTMLRGYARRGRAGRQVSLCRLWLLCMACAVQLQHRTDLVGDGVAILCAGRLLSQLGLSAGCQTTARPMASF